MTGYSLGWYVCDDNGHEIFIHSGGLESDDETAPKIRRGYMSNSPHGIPLSAQVTRHGDDLQLQVAELQMSLLPSRPNVFATLITPLEKVGSIEFHRDTP